MLRALLLPRSMRPGRQHVRHLAAVANQKPPRRARVASISSLPPGSLCYDHVFKRILGTENQSEEILVDLLSAWRLAITGCSSSVVTDVTIVATDVKEGMGVHEKGALTVDVRARDAESNFIVEVQHRTEALFPHRALSYAAADIVGQPLVGEQVEKGQILGFLRPVHVLAFCDFSFGAPKAGSKLHVGTSMSPSRWRRSDAAFKHQRDPTLALHSFGLLPLGFTGTPLADQQGNPYLEHEMQSRLSFLFALLPHAPLLHEVTASTPPILKWAALIAHLRGCCGWILLER